MCHKFIKNKHEITVIITGTIYTPLYIGSARKIQINSK